MIAFVREIVWDLRGNRSNAGLSFLALCVAMCSFVLVSVAGHIGTDALVARSEQVNGRPVTTQATLTTEGWSREKVASLVAAMDTWDPSLSQGVLLMDYSARLADGQSATLRLVAGDYQAARRITLTSGRWFNNSPYPGEAVVNSAALAAIGNTSAASVDLGYRPARSLVVVGVVSDGSAEPLIYASASGISVSTNMLPPSKVAMLAHSSVQDVDAATALMGDAARTVGIREALDYSRIDEASQIKDSLSAVSNVFLLVSLTGLVVAVIGMINVGIASVRERARDFTIRRAMGASRARIISIVAASTVAIGIAATAVSVALCYLAIQLLIPLIVTSSSGIQDPPFPWLVAGYAALGGIAASLLSGLIPALRTRSLDIAALLRE